MKYEDLKISIKDAALLLDTLCVYRKLLNDPVVHAYHMLLKHTAGNSGDKRFYELYSAFFNLLAANSPTVNFPGYVAEILISDENPFTMSCGSSHPDASGILAFAAQKDLKAIQAAISLPSRLLKDSCVSSHPSDTFEGRLAQGLPEWEHRQEPAPVICSSNIAEIKKLLLSSDDWSESTACLQDFHRVNGAGVFALNYAFIWQPDLPSGFAPVTNSDPVRLSDLIAYESEREEVVRNTEQFLKGYPANNVLLYGDRGTGKSSTVKALLNEYHDRGLRMVEVRKSMLTDFPEIVRRLKDRNHKFIIFVDDLAFEDNEENYTALKAVLEGGLETRPANVLIYATSNRRHLIREKFSDRAGLQYGSAEDEVRAADSIQEMLSLSDRFGITVVFSSPDKKRYLEIIEELTCRKGIKIDHETLQKEAMKWELWYNGRSPRTARQFINWLEGKYHSQD